jgi:hypothetical protein
MANEKSYLVSSGQVLLYSDGHVESRIHYFDEHGKSLATPDKAFSQQTLTPALGEMKGGVSQGR